MYQWKYIGHYQGVRMEVSHKAQRIAFRVVNELIKRKHKSKSAPIELGDSSFTEIENYYHEIMMVFKHNHDVREDLVSSLKALHEQGVDLNQLYPTELIVNEGSLLKLLS
jgi:hypothetical protein